MIRFLTRPSETTKSTSRVAFRLLNSLCGSNDNVCVSPLSIAIALQLALCGAAGKTLEEILQSLDIRCAGREDLARDYYESMRLLLDQSRGTGFEGEGARVRFSIANSIWCDERVSLHPGFVDYLQRYYAAEARSMNFADGETLKAINGWVSAKTSGKIPFILNGLDPAQILVLINCAYFKATWASEFSPLYTRKDNFYLSPQEPIQIPMMRKETKLWYHRDQSCEIAELPYTDLRFAMYVILPAMGTSLKHFVAGFSQEQYWRTLSQLSEHFGEFSMPRFKFHYGRNLVSQLEQLGIHEAFSDKANFWNMLVSNQPGLPFFKIDEVVHKTFIEVDETGTEAAAATAVAMTSGFRQPATPPQFKMIVDRPFMFVISERESGAILFAGSVSDPRSAGT